MKCEYCKNLYSDNKLIANRRGFEVDIDPHEKTIDLYYYECGYSASVEVNINYCPMCGRKLGESNDK